MTTTSSIGSSAHNSLGDAPPVPVLLLKRFGNGFCGNTLGYPQWTVHQTACCDTCVPDTSTGREEEGGGRGRGRREGEEGTISVVALVI